MTEFRWAIFGTGEVSRKFVLGLPRGHAARFASSRSGERTAAFAQDLGIAQHEAGYPVPRDVDCVYIATPPSEHEALAIRCLDAGLPVLVEKPFATSAEAASRIVDAARRNGVFAMEAMWTRFLPVVLQAREAIADGAIGDIRMIVGSLGIAHDVSADGAKFDAARGGGALVYYGVYPLAVGAFLAGAWADADGIVRMGSTGVDEDASITVRYASGALGSYSTSLRATLENDLRVYGTRGSLRLAAPLFRPSYSTVTHSKARGPEKGAGRSGKLREATLAQSASRTMRLITDAVPRGLVRAKQTGNGYGYEAAEVSERIRGGHKESEIMPLDETISILRLMDRLKQGPQA